MRKLSLLISSCIAVVALAAFSAPALAVVDPSCDGDPYPNDFAVHDFTISTPNSPIDRQVSGVEGSWIVCGTELSSGFGGWQTLTDNSRMILAPGFVLNPTAQFDEGDPTRGRLIGFGVIDAAGYATASGSLPLIAQDQVFDLRVDSIGERDPETGQYPPGTCGRENDELDGGLIPGTVIVCYRADSLVTPGAGGIPSHNWNWVVEDADGSKTLVVGPIFNDVHVPGSPSSVRAGITRIVFRTCGYLGGMDTHKRPGGTPSGADDCGDGSSPSEWIAKNGDCSALWPWETPATYPTSQKLTCSAKPGAGQFTVAVINKAGQTTAPVSTRVSWLKPLRAMPHR